MESHLKEESLWASGLAARLRLIQATSADDPPATRQSFIAEELERALKDVVPSKRQLFLSALGERFPAWQAPASAPADETSQPASAIEETPEALLARLLQTVPALSPEVRENMARQLREAGLLPAQSQGSMEIPPEYQKKFALPAGKQLNFERVIKLLGALYEMTLAMDQLAWALWKQIAPQTNIRKAGDFGKLVGPYLLAHTKHYTQHHL